MERKIIVVGDPPALGGRVLPYVGPEHSIHGHQVALIGGRAYCEGCYSVGIIAKAGGWRRGIVHNAEIALEGDVVVCHCQAPPALISTLQQSATYDDALVASVREFSASFTALPGWYAGDATTVAASKKAVDGMVKHPPESEQTENICPNMTNKQFCSTMLDLRDKAVSLISKKRLPELGRWGKADQARVEEWFGVADQPMREYLQKGLSACERVLKGLDCKNFIRLTDSGTRLSCTVPNHDESTVAMVCKPDVQTHTIAINVSFCEFRATSANQDSKLSTLIHEVTHFNDTFGSFDTLYYLDQSRAAAKTDPKGMKTNADSIAGYVVWDEMFYAS